MVSAVDRTKRALVSLLKSLAVVYRVVLSVTRESSDQDVRTAYRKLSRKVHPDHNGDEEHQKSLNNAYEEWQTAEKERKQQSTGPGRPVAQSTSKHEQRRGPGFRFQGVGVLLTFQKFEDEGVWQRFVAFLQMGLERWGVLYWCATMETNGDGTFHLHAMLQFHRAKNRDVGDFTFEAVRPNGRPNDLLGEGWGGRREQVSLDRGFFYVFADKVGTARVEGQECVAGNYKPAWTGEPKSYPVRGQWVDNLLKAYKLTLDSYDAYLHLCRDGVPFRKRNLEALRQREDELELKHELKDRAKRLRNNPTVYQPFSLVPEAQAWLEVFQAERMRYPLLLVLAPSFTGKTEWAKSLFSSALLVQIGDLGHFPAKMRQFSRKLHDGLVVDDVRDLAFLTLHQEKLQGSYENAVEFGSTPSGDYSYWRDLWKVPVVVTVNHDTKNLDFLQTSDWLSKKTNVHFLSFSSKPGDAPPQTSWPLQEETYFL